jgi:uncharacterized protein YndB with AHSA1/START domain
MTDRIEKSIELRAPVERVWRALTDHAEFGQWFGVKLDGPFEAGEVSRGTITTPGYEHIVWQARVVKIEKPRSFAFTWHPYAVDASVDYSQETPTLVEFTLAPVSPTETRLTVVESGFDALPIHRRAETLRMNEGGWAQQVKNIKTHVER